MGNYLNLKGFLERKNVSRETFLTPSSYNKKA